MSLSKGVNSMRTAAQKTKKPAPAMVIILSTLSSVIAFSLYKIVAEFQKVFNSFKSDLPWLTSIIANAPTAFLALAALCILAGLIAVTTKTKKSCNASRSISLFTIFMLPITAVALYLPVMGSN